jgi:hypothetical protein
LDNEALPDSDCWEDTRTSYDWSSRVNVREVNLGLLREKEEKKIRK